MAGTRCSILGSLFNNDDDFQISSPPSKRSKTLSSQKDDKKRNREDKKKRGSVSEICKPKTDECKVVLEDFALQKHRVLEKKRMSIAEKLFQRDLQIAIQMSKSSPTHENTDAAAEPVPKQDKTDVVPDDNTCITTSEETVIVKSQGTEQMKDTMKVAELKALETKNPAMEQVEPVSAHSTETAFEQSVPEPVTKAEPKVPSVEHYKPVTSQNTLVSEPSVSLKTGKADSKKLTKDEVKIAGAHSVELISEPCAPKATRKTENKKLTKEQLKPVNSSRSEAVIKPWEPSVQNDLVKETTKQVFVKSDKLSSSQISINTRKVSLLESKPVLRLGLSRKAVVKPLHTCLKSNV